MNDSSEQQAIEARVVETESGREVRMPYRRGCHNYAIGFASAFMWAAAVCGYGLLWRAHVPESLYQIAVVGFVVFSLTGFAIVGIGYTRPVWFYESMEDEQ